MPSVPKLHPIAPYNAQNAFNYLLNSVKFEYRYAYGACEDRAHFISKVLTKQNIDNMKIWCFAPVRYTLISKKDLYVKDPLGINDTIHWTYHVAPIVITIGKISNDTLVFDPSLNSQTPLPYKNWLAALNCPEAIYTFAEKDMYLFNSLNGFTAWENKDSNDSENFTLPLWFPNIISGDFIAYDEKSNSIPIGMATNEIAVMMFNQEKNSLSKDELKTILGNINNITAFLDDTELNDIVNADFKTKYKTYVGKYKEIYSKRVFFWTTEYGNLK